MNSTVSPLQTQRLFFALWPEPALGRELHALTEKTLRHGEGRRIAAENIHLTLAFLGSVDAPFRECAERAAASTRAKAFTLTLEQIDCWSKTGILWAGPKHVPEPLLFLVQELTARLATCGYEPDRRVYAAHLTLARKVRRCPPPVPLGPLVWEVHRFCMVQSHMDAQGAHYEILHAWELNRTAA
ncbi:MAG TPA: RNA 2',3'-cyclic phosphodiesterase [Candidatus Methylomirabilis sp.]|nr:RNA 2',3'-cyclic phosphodiesterase [Candidatus Methylomirabilis sp.]